MKLAAIKGVPVLVLGSALGIYAATILGHVFIEYSFDRSTLQTQESLLEIIPGAQLAAADKTLYCVDDAVVGRAVGPGRWYEDGCETGPARRITVFSRYLRKYWVLYLDEAQQVVFKRSWVVL